MANPYYNASNSPSVGSRGSSASIRAEFDAISAGFNLLPVLTANALMQANGSGTALIAGDPCVVGTWTPTITCNSPGDLSITYANREGNVVRIGKLVFVNLRVKTSSFTWTTAAGLLLVGALPYPAIGGLLDGRAKFVGPVIAQGVTNATYLMGALVTSSSFFLGINVGINDVQVVIADCPSAGTVDISGSIIYQTS